MNPDEIADVAERIAAIAVELVKQVATPVYAAALTKVVATNQVGLWASIVIGAILLGLSLLCFWRWRTHVTHNKSMTAGDGWIATGVALVLCEVPVICFGASSLAAMRSAEYWAFILVRDMLMGR